MADERVFTVKINGVEKAIKDSTRLVDVLNSLHDINVKVSAENDKVTKTTEEKTKALTEEEKAQKKLLETQDRATKVITDIEKAQALANEQLRERTQFLKDQAKLENGSIQQTSESTKQIKEKAKVLTEEEKAQKKLIDTYNKRLQLDSAISKAQVRANQDLRERSKELAREVELETASSGSIDEKRLQLATLGRQYRALSEEQRSQEHVGGAMLKQIQDLRSEYNELEKSLGNYTVDVGNYGIATKGLNEKIDALGEGINKTAENTKAMLNLVQAGAGFVALFGDESDSTKKILLEVGKVLAIINALQAANNVLLQKGAVSSKAAATMEGVHAIQVRARATAIALSTKETLTATIAQKAFNLVAKANPYVLLTTGLLAVVGGLYTFIELTGDATDAESKFQSSIDGARFATQEALTSHNEHLRTIRDLSLEYRILTGAVSTYEAELEKIANKRNDKVQDSKEKRIQAEKEAGDSEIEIAEYVSGAMGVIGAYRLYDKWQNNKQLKDAAQKAAKDEIDITKNANEVLEEETKLSNKRKEQANKEFTEKTNADLKTGKAKDLALLEISYKKELDEAVNVGGSIAIVNQKYNKERTEINKKYAEQSVKASQELTNKKREIEQKNLDYVRKFEDSLTATYTNEFDKRRTETELNYEREKSDLERKLKEDKDINKEGREAINGIIETLEIKRQSELDKIRIDEIAKEKEKNEKIIENRKTLLDIELDMIDNFYDDIQYKASKVEVRDDKGIINVEATRKNLNEIDTSLGAYLLKLQDSKKNVSDYYDSLLSIYEKDSIDYTKTLHEKEQTLRSFDIQTKNVQDEITDNTKKNTDLQREYWENLSTVLQKYAGEVMTGVSAIFDATNMLLQSQLDEANEKFDAINAKYDEALEKREESNSKLESLEEQSKSARGGRLLVIQEQISREMEANKQLAVQEQQLAKDKEKAEAEVLKKEKQLKKSELTQNIVQAIANVALGVTKALSLGPILGPILAAVLGAAGAVQIGVMTKQLSKLEDGGLLNGKRHSQGGMRVEGTNIEVEGGEYVVNRESTNKNLGLIKYINSQRRELSPNDITSFLSSSSQNFETPFKRMFEDGGQLPSIVNSVTVDNASLIEAIQSMKFEPKVSVIDINKAQTDTVIVNNWTGL